MKGQTSFTLEELAKQTGSTLIGDPKYIIEGFSDLETAGERDVSFLSNPRYTNTRYTNLVKVSKAGVIFISPETPQEEGRNFLVTEDPSRAFQITIEAIRGGELKKTGFPSIHTSAVIHQTVSIGQHVVIGPNAVIDEGVSIADHSFIGSGTYIGPHTVIGNHCTIHPNVTIRENCIIGNRVVIQPGTVIGSCGFGYTTSNEGIHQHLSHIGSVTIEDDVEIGANSTIDRARFTSTTIAKGTKIDNLVVIGHNVRVGRHNLICGQSAIAGSTQTGSHVVIAGQCGIDGHIKLDDGVIITAKSGVSKSLKTGRYGGIPVQPLDQHNRTNVNIRNLDKHVKLIKELQKRMEQLEK